MRQTAKVVWSASGTTGRGGVEPDKSDAQRIIKALEYIAETLERIEAKLDRPPGGGPAR